MNRENLVAQGNVASLQTGAHLWAERICEGARVRLLHHLEITRFLFLRNPLDLAASLLSFNLPPPLCVVDACQPPVVLLHHHLRKLQSSQSLTPFLIKLLFDQF